MKRTGKYDYMEKAAGALHSCILLSSSMAPIAHGGKAIKVGKIITVTPIYGRTGGQGRGGDSPPAIYGPLLCELWEVTNDNGDTLDRVQSAWIDIVLGVEDEEEYYFASTSSSSFKLTLGSSSKYRFDRIKIVDASTKDSNATLILTIQLMLIRTLMPSSCSLALAGMTPATVWSWNQFHPPKYYPGTADEGQLRHRGDMKISMILPITLRTDYIPGTYRFKVRSVKSITMPRAAGPHPNAWAVQ